MVGSTLSPGSATLVSQQSVNEEPSMIARSFTPYISISLHQVHRYGAPAITYATMATNWVCLVMWWVLSVAQLDYKEGFNGLVIIIKIL